MKLQKEWIDFLREQYPHGSRIRLREMKDPYHPMEPGTMGTLDCIDDVGTFHVKWDNGSGLGLVIGEDSFTVLPPETHLLKLYMPMTMDCYEKNEWGDTEDEPTELDNHTAAGYADHIVAALMRERLSTETERGLMHYYDKNDSVEQKVKSCDFTVEVRNGRLWGVAECQVTGELTPKELYTLKEYISGQASDGFGEGFEQHAIKFGDGEMYAHLWSCNNSWSIQTEQEQFSPVHVPGADPKADDQAPQMGGMTLG